MPVLQITFATFILSGKIRFKWCITNICKRFSYVGNYPFHNLHVYSVVLVHQWGEETWIPPYSHAHSHKCLLYLWFDVFGKIWSSIVKEFVDTIGNVLLIFMFYFHLQNALDMEYNFDFFGLPNLRASTFLLYLCAVFPVNYCSTLFLHIVRYLSTYFFIFILGICFTFNVFFIQTVFLFTCICQTLINRGLYFWCTPFLTGNVCHIIHWIY